MPLNHDDLADVIADAIKAATAPLLARIVLLESKEWPAAVVGEKGEPGRDGRDAEPVTREQIAESIAAMPDVIEKAVEAYVVAHPPKDGADGKDGKDADVDLDALALKAAELIPAPKDGPPGPPGASVDPASIEAIVAKAVSALPAPKDGEPGKSVDPEELAAMVRREAVAAVAEIPLPMDGKDGRSVTVEDVAPLIAEQVTKAVALLPVPKDGLGVSDALMDHDGRLVLAFSDGTLKEIGVVKGQDGEKGEQGAPGAPGANGIDGRDGTLENLKVSFDGKRTLTLSFKDGTPIEGGVIKLEGLTRYEGVWSVDRAYEIGDQTTYSGSQWTAKADSIGKQPGTNDGAAFWQLSVKRGDTGKVGPPGPKGEKGLDGKHGIDLRRS